jgi:hypothetical protein
MDDTAVCSKPTEYSQTPTVSDCEELLHSAATANAPTPIKATSILKPPTEIPNGHG